MLADPDHGRARGPRARSPTRRTRRPAHRYAADASPARGLGQLELSPQRGVRRRTTVTYHMNRLQSLDADREFLVTLNRSAESTRRGSCGGSATRIRSTPRGRSPHSGAGARSAASRAPTSVAPTGAGGFTRMASGARCARARRSARSSGAARSSGRPGWRWRHDRLGAVRGLGQPPAPDAGRALLPLPRPDGLLDLDELPGALDLHPLWSARRPAPVRFRRRDHLGGAAAPLREAARDLVEERIGRRPGGPVRLLTTPRFCGIGFNPVCFHYLHEEGGRKLEAVIAEVTNTPWGERHSYVLEGGARGRARGHLPEAPARVTVHADGADLPVAADRAGGGPRRLDLLRAGRRPGLRGEPGAAPARAEPPPDVAGDARPSACGRIHPVSDLLERPEAEAQGRSLPPAPGGAG